MVDASLVRESVRRFDVDLSGLVVFTEAATGAFACTAGLALAAGASHVLALAKGSRFGTRAEAAAQVLALARALGRDDQLTVVDDHARIDEAHLVTNTGHVRPLSEAVIARMRPRAVVSLMWETWEFRPRDLDLGACLDRGVMVLGTNESDQRLRSLDEVGKVAATLVRDAGVPLEHARVVVAGGGVFGSSTIRHLRALGTTAFAVSTTALDPDVDRFRVSSRLCSRETLSLLREADALIVADHDAETTILGARGELTVENLAHANHRLVVACVSGLVDARALRDAGFVVVPDHVVSEPRTMSATLAVLGPRPVVDLHAAGLKVGQTMATAIGSSATLADARSMALRNPLCQDFAPHQYEAAREARAAMRGCH